MAKKQLYINLASSIFSFFVSFVITFFLTPFIINNIGKEAYSFFPISNSILNCFFIMSIALNTMLARNISIDRSRGDPESALRYFSSGFYSNVILILLFAPLMSLFVYFVDVFLQVPTRLLTDVRLMFAFVFISMLIGLIGSVYSVATYTENRLDLRSLGEIVRGGIRIFLFLALFYYFEPSLYFIGLISFLLSIYLLVFNKYISFRLAPELKVNYSKFDFSKVKELLASGSWVSINTLGATLLTGVALVLTNRFISVESGGDVAISLMLPVFITSFISTMASVLQPWLTKAYASKSTGEFVEEVVSAQKLLSLLTTTPIVLLIIFSPSIFKLWIPGEYSNVLDGLSIIFLFPILIHGNMWIYFNYGFITGRMKEQSFILLLMSVVVCGASLVFVLLGGKNIYIIPLITAIASVLYYLFFIPIQVIGRTGASIKKIYSPIIISLLFSVLFIYLSHHFFEFFYVGEWIGLLFTLAVVGLIFITIHMFLLFNVRSLIAFKKKRFG